MRFSPRALLDRDGRAAGGHAAACGAPGSTFTRASASAASCRSPGRVLAHPADHVHARAQPPGRGGLVGALPAGRDLGAAADDRLPAPGQPADGHQHVLVQAADDGDGHARTSRARGAGTAAIMEP